MNLEHFQKILDEEKTKLEAQIKQYKEEDPYEDIGRTRGILEDDITEIEEHDRLDATKNELVRALKETNSALKRIAEGTFGKCTNCGDQISPERLEIVPTANLCLACQQSKLRA